MTDNRDELLRDMQSLIDFLGAHPELPLPDDLTVSVYAIGAETLDRAKELAKSLGTFEKEIDDPFFALVKRFGKVSLRFVFYRQSVCIKRVVGTKTDTIRVPAEGAPKVEMIDKVVETEIVEWDCPSLLSETDSEALSIPSSFADDEIPF